MLEYAIVCIQKQCHGASHLQTNIINKNPSETLNYTKNLIFIDNVSIKNIFIETIYRYLLIVLIPSLKFRKPFYRLG